MEYNLKKSTVPVKELFLDAVMEQPVDADVTLPDYCPDIEKILKCSLIPKIYAKSVSGGQLSVDGASLLRILYVDSVKNNIRSFDCTVPFSASFPLSSMPEQYIACVDTKTEYVNCRALSQRKLSIHGAFSLYAKVIGRKSLETCSAQDCELQAKTENIRVSALSCLCEETFSHVEDISLSGKAPLEAPVSSMLCVKITELRCIHNKIMLSAEGELRLLYLSDLDEGTIEHMSCTFPLSRVIDCEGVEEDAILDARLDVMNFELRKNSDALGDGDLLNLEVKLSFCAMGYEEEELEIIEDAFSTDESVELLRRPLSASEKTSVSRFTRTFKTTLTLENESVGEVLDLCCHGVSVTPGVNNDVTTLSSKVRLALLMKDAEKTPFYIERTAEFECDFEGDGLIESACASCESLSYRIVDEKSIEVRVELCFKVVSCFSLSRNPVSEVLPSRDTTVEKDDSALILYFADCGESVWDIAKRYRARPSSLMRENSLESDVLDSDSMLLIPID